MKTKKQKFPPLAPITVKIIMCLVPKDETHNIATESGTMFPEKNLIFLLQKFIIKCR